MLRSVAVCVALALAGCSQSMRDGAGEDVSSWAGLCLRELKVDSEAINTARLLRPLSESVATALAVAEAEGRLRGRGALWGFVLQWRRQLDTTKTVEEVGAAMAMASLRGLVAGGPFDLEIAPEVARTASGRKQLWSLLSLSAADCAEQGCPLSVIGTLVDAVGSHGVSDSSTTAYLRGAFCRLVEVYSDTVTRGEFHDANRAERDTLGAIDLASFVLAKLSRSSAPANVLFVRSALRVAPRYGSFGKAIVEAYNEEGRTR